MHTAFRRAKPLPPERSEMVDPALMADHGISKRRAYSASGIARSTLRYWPVPCDDSGLTVFIQSHRPINPRHGFDIPFSHGHRACIFEIAKIGLAADVPNAA